MSEVELSEMKKLANNCLHDFQSFIVKSLKIYKLIENKYQKIHEIDLKQTDSDKIFWIQSTRTLLDQVNRHIKPLVGVLQQYKDR